MIMSRPSCLIRIQPNAYWGFSGIHTDTTSGWVYPVVDSAVEQATYFEEWGCGVPLERENIR